MPRTTDSRDRMVRSAATLMRRQGYAATGWRQVVAESSTPWGSQAHHFPGGKTQLAADAVELAGREYEQLLRDVLGSDHPAAAVATWCRYAAFGLESSGWADGCPVATVTLETAHDTPALADACGAALSSWHVALTDSMVSHGADDADAHSLATIVLAAIEGALIIARATHDTAPLLTVGDELATLLHARLP